MFYICSNYLEFCTLPVHYILFIVFRKFLLYLMIMLYHRFTGFLSKALLSSSSLVRSIFNESVYFTYSSTGYNFRYGYLHIKKLSV